MSKSWTTLEQKFCPITGTIWDTGDLIIDQKMREKFEMHTITGVEICPDAQKMIDDGYFAFVAVDLDKSDKLPSGNIDPKGAYFLGRTAWVRKHVAEKLAPRIAEGENPSPFCYTEDASITLIESLQPKEEKE